MTITIRLRALLMRTVRRHSSMVVLMLSPQVVVMNVLITLVVLISLALVLVLIVGSKRWLKRNPRVTKFTTNLNHCIKIICPLLCKQGSSRVFDIRNMLVQVMKRACWFLSTTSGGGKLAAMPMHVKVDVMTDVGRRTTMRLERRTTPM